MFENKNLVGICFLNFFSCEFVFELHFVTSSFFETPFLLGCGFLKLLSANGLARVGVNGCLNFMLMQMHIHMYLYTHICMCLREFVFKLRASAMRIRTFISRRMYMYRFNKCVFIHHASVFWVHVYTGIYMCKYVDTGIRFPLHSYFLVDVCSRMSECVCAVSCLCVGRYILMCIRACICVGI